MSEDDESKSSSTTSGSPLPNTISVGFYRRMSPEEDLLATISGIEVLLRQREQLITKYASVKKRKIEMNQFSQFSKRMDTIIRSKNRPEVKRGQTKF